MLQLYVVVFGLQPTGCLVKGVVKHLGATMSYSEKATELKLEQGLT